MLLTTIITYTLIVINLLACFTIIKKQVFSTNFIHWLKYCHEKFISVGGNCMECQKSHMGKKVTYLFLLLLLYFSDNDVISDRFDFLHNVLGFEHEKLATFPQLFTVTSTSIKIRHQFLRSLGRDQYDPKKPNYVPGQALCTMEEEEFLEQFAKSSRDTYIDFLKTL